MATKSVFKNINPRTRKSAIALVTALENAKCKGSKSIVKREIFPDASR